MNYPVLHDLRAEGVTDYLITPLHFSNGEIHFTSWTTRQPAASPMSRSARSTR
jgi:adenylate cyclase